MLQLTGDEEKWRDELRDRLPKLSAEEDKFKSLGEMRDIAVRLHNSLKARGIEPKHHEYMIANRGTDPKDPKFYFHPHPIEDLVKFTFDPRVNDDPVDKTIGHEFDIRIFTRRWGHDDTYKIKRTPSGWFVKANIYSGPCDKKCNPVLFECLRHDFVEYPRDIGEWFEWLWQQAKDQGLDHEAVQKGIDDIANWIKVTEQKAPTDGIWQGFA